MLPICLVLQPCSFPVSLFLLWFLVGELLCQVLGNRERNLSTSTQLGGLESSPGFLMAHLLPVHPGVRVLGDVDHVAFVHSPLVQLKISLQHVP